MEKWPIEFYEKVSLLGHRVKYQKNNSNFVSINFLFLYPRKKLGIFLLALFKENG